MDTRCRSTQPAFQSFPGGDSTIRGVPAVCPLLCMKPEGTGRFPEGAHHLSPVPEIPGYFEDTGLFSRYKAEISSSP